MRGCRSSPCAAQKMFSHFQGGFLLAKPMREKRCVTMLDPFQAKYGRVVSVGMSLTSLMTEIICVPTTLIALGESVIFFFF